MLAWDIGVQYGRNKGNVESLNGAQFITYNLEGFNGAIGASAVGFAPGVIQGTDFVRCGRGITNFAVTGMGVVADIDAHCAETRRRVRSSSAPMDFRSRIRLSAIIADPNPKYTMSYSSSCAGTSCRSPACSMFARAEAFGTARAASWTSSELARIQKTAR